MLILRVQPRTPIRAVSVLAALALAAFAAPANAQYLFTSIADDTTGTPNGGTYGGFSNPAVSGVNVAFLGSYSGGTGTSGIFRSNGVITTGVARASSGDSSGDATPNGGNFTSLSAPVIDGTGVTFIGGYTGGTGTTAIFRNDGTTTTSSVRSGSSDNPGETNPYGGTFNGVVGPAVSGSDVAFRAGYTGGTGTNGIFRSNGTSITGIVRGGNDSNPGDTTPYGGTFTSFNNPAISGNNIAFRSNFTGGSGLGGIFRHDGTTTTGIARGSTVTDPGSATPNGGTFTSLGAPAISGNNIAFTSQYVGGTGNRGLFRHDGTTITSIARNRSASSNDGTELPNSSQAQGGGRLVGFLGDPAMSGDTIAFRASVGSDARFGIFAVTNGVFTRVVGQFDSLFGSSISDLDFAPAGMDGKNIAFRYTTDDGRNDIRRGIGLATHLSPTVGITVAPRQNATFPGDFTQTAGSSVINGDLSVEHDFRPNRRGTLTIAGGTLSGTGNITGNVAITGGTLAPGNSPGTFSMVGNYTQSSGIFAVELASGTLFDVLNVDGAVAFTGGSFSVSTLGGFTPTVGQFFDIVTTTGGITGFDAVSVPSGYTFTPSGNNGRLTFVGVAVVPEANAGLLALLALPALGMVAFARRRR